MSGPSSLPIDQDPRFAAPLNALTDGRAEEALAQCLAILARDPRHPDALHLAGLAMVRTGQADKGIALIEQALTIRPGFAPFHNSLGTGLSQLGRQREAIAVYKAAAAARPGSVEILNNLAAACEAAGLIEEALHHYRRALRIAPASGPIWRNLARCLEGHAPAEAVEQAYRQAIAVSPDQSAIRADFGHWLLGQGRWADAEAALSDAVSLDPTDPAAWHNLARARAEHGDLTGAEDGYRRSLKLDPGRAGSHFNLGCLLHLDGRTDEALASFHLAVAADPSHGAARIARCTCVPAILYESADEVSHRRALYLRALDELRASVAAPDIAVSVAAAIGSTQPFFLPYQGEDDLAPQMALGTMLCDLAARAWPEGAPRWRVRPTARHQKIRIGIVSGWFQDHTVFRLFIEGWLRHLDRNRFEVSGFHTGPGRDGNTAWAATVCDTFVQDIPSVTAWRKTLAAADQDVLLYPEVGMDPTAGFLAAHRLAPVQCVAWGQPVTTGMPTMDYFLSSDLMEPPDGAAHYSERLVRLPGLGICFRQDEACPPPARRATLGLPDDGIVFWSGQALYKYHPRHDEVFPRIARRVDAARFLFIGFARGARVTAMFRTRLDRVFARFGLDARHYCRILPPMDQNGFLAAMGTADVILDTIGWSGGRSTLDGLVWNTPVVTLPGRFMRGRHTAAILRQAGCEETIATSVDHYIEIAASLARDPEWRAGMRRRMAAGVPAVFEDAGTIRALEAFLTTASRGARQ
jgi:predicted O-linked N-acetylglucosamine transferase (SPINDLY family)